MEQTIISRKELAKKWGCDERTIKAREDAGIIRPCKGLPGTHYLLKDVYKAEGLTDADIHQISPFEYHKLEAQYKAALDRIEQLEGKLYKLAAMACEEVAAEVRREKA